MNERSLVADISAGIVRSCPGTASDCSSHPPVSNELCFNLLIRLVFRKFGPSGHGADQRTASEEQRRWWRHDGIRHINKPSMRRMRSDDQRSLLIAGQVNADWLNACHVIC